MSKRSFTAFLFIAVLVFASVFGLNKRETNTLLSLIDINPKQEVLDEKVMPDDNNSYVVTRIIDGDTIELNGGITVRYIGIDTPESVDPRRSVGCFAKEASIENKRLVLGKKVILEKDVSETDRYGRLLRYVYVNNIMINKTLVEEGFAQARSYPPDIKYQEELRKLESEARNGRKGLWGSCEQS